MNWSFSTNLKRITANIISFEDENLALIFRGGAIGLSGLFIVTLINFGHQFILATILTPANLGIYNLASTITSFVGLAVLFGLDRAVTRFIAVFIGEGNRNYELGVITSSVIVITITALLITPAFWFSADYLSTFVFNKPELTVVLRILTLSVPCWALIRLLMSILQGYSAFKFVVFIEQIIFPVLRVIGLISVFLLFERTSSAAAYSYLWAALIVFIVSVIVVRNYYLKRRGDFHPTLMLPKLVAFSFPLLLASFLYRSNAFTEIIILGIFSSAEQVGLYTFSFKLSMTLIIFFEAIHLIISPHFSNLFGKENKGEIARQYRIVTYWIFSITLPFILWMFLEASTILAIFNPAFILGERVLQILILAQLVYIIVGPASVTLIVTGHTRMDLVDLIVLLVLSLLLDLLLIPTYGIFGAAAAGLISIAFVNLLRTIQIYSILKIHPFSRCELIPLCAGIIASLLMLGISFWYTGLAHLLHLSISASVLFLGYGTSMVVLRKVSAKYSFLNDL